MTGVWVDTDFGFDDLWALLLLRYLECPVAGVSLVAGNAPLEQVAANAMGAKLAYGFGWPVWQGAARPLIREPETAQRVLGPTGMRSRGQHLPRSGSDPIPTGANAALREWLVSDRNRPHRILALGPLTNIALLIQDHPALAATISRLVWMGASTGPGNHTPQAEFNALADAEALSVVADAGLALDIVDLQFCRKVSFGPSDIPVTDDLTRDLAGGYLDIALDRGRTGMAIYDPLAALALARPELFEFSPCDIAVSTKADESYGATRFAGAGASSLRIASGASTDLAPICLAALKREAIDGS